MNKRLYSKKKSDAVSGYLFLLPALLAFLLFIGAPMVITIVLSFFDYNMLQGSEWINFDNYIEFFKNPTSWQIIWNTFKLTLILVALHIVIALLLAFVIYKEKRGPVKYVYRTAVYLPSILTTASVAIAWYYMFNYDLGVFNWLLSQLGISGVKWLTSSSGVIVAICLFSLWKFVGTPFLYYLIGLQGIPDGYYEAAQIDGANKIQTFFHITLPMLTPTLFFVITITTINTFQIFDEPYIITNGGPGNASRTLALHVYEKAFKAYEMGYASSVSVVLFIICLVITILLYSTQNKWVTYDVE
ncbi:MAG: carbohydrate ABC transporter permease [[Clostridium] leptum]